MNLFNKYYVKKVLPVLLVVNFLVIVLILILLSFQTESIEECKNTVKLSHHSALVEIFDSKQDELTTHLLLKQATEDFYQSMQNCEK